jgi:hypothetical protein
VKVYYSPLKQKYSLVFAKKESGTKSLGTPKDMIR